MSEEAGKDDADLFLSALADGEADALTAEQRAVMLRHLATAPRAAARLAAEMQLRHAVGRQMTHAAPAPIDQFRRSIEVLADSAEKNADPQLKDERSTWGKLPGIRPGRPRRWFIWPAAVAAMVLVALGLWMGREIFQGPSVGQGPVPASLVADITHIHVDCSRAPSQHTADFPKELGTLKESLKRTLGRPAPYPDLSSIGYQYIGAGPCAKPMENIVHLLYGAKGGPVTDTISLFVQLDGAGDKLREGKVYWAAGKDAAHPMIVWRRDNMTFYLVGDASQPVLEAATVMGEPSPL